MNNDIVSDLNNSTKPKICKQLWPFGDKHLVVIDKSIIQKLGITEDSIVCLEQEITSDNTIRMKIKRF